MQFQIEQVAVSVKNTPEAIELLKAIGATDWALDHVVAKGRVHGVDGSNAANLAFNYQLSGDLDKPLEFEVLEYVDGPNWIDGAQPLVSHLGMHCTAEELEQWEEFFRKRGIGMAQSVNTLSHTNEAIKDKRRYTYVIFDTRAIIGVDLKFIVRREIEK